LFLTRVEGILLGKSGRGAWELTGAEDFFRGHFPGEPVVPGVLIGEALAQLSGLVGLHTDGKGGSGRLVQIEVRFDRPVVPPAVIGLRAEVVRELGSLRQFEVSAEVEGEVVARGSLTLSEGGAT
jgi:3-hydroxyacyl-[acyl-carrier-protein] dehydratase